MSSKKMRFRPTVQTLESRRCLAGALGMDEVGATPEEPAMPDDAASQLTAPEGQTKNEPYVSEIRISTWTWPPATAEDDVYIDGKIITAENYDSAAFFSELGSDNTGKITAPGQGGGPHVKVFDGSTDAADGVTDVSDFNIWNGQRFASDEADAFFNDYGRGGGEHSNNFEEIK